jgi:hypothetical protein
VLLFIIVSALFLVPVTVCLIGLIVSETRLKEFFKLLMKLACMPHVNLFQDYIKETEDDSTPIHEIDPEILDHYLSAFFCWYKKERWFRILALCTKF